MRVSDIRVETAGPDRARLLAEIRYDQGRRPPETLYFETELALADQLSRSGNPWVALCLPAASTWGEAIEVDRPVDPQLLAGCRRIMETWRGWFGYPQVVRIDADAATALSPPARQAAFFSGGVDSFFTALDHGDGSGLQARGSVQDLVLLLGFDVRLYKESLLARSAQAARRVADALHFDLVTMGVNVQDTQLRDVDWAALAHGSVLAASALALEGRWTSMLVPASYDYANAVPWGSHPEVDPFFSTSTLALQHDGATYDKADKIERVAQHPLVQQLVRVCQRRPQNLNCGKCEKCLYTALALEVLVGLDRCEAFDADAVDLEDIRHTRISKAWYVRCYTHIREHAAAKDRQDIVAAIDHMMRRSVHWSGWVKALEAARRRRLLWPLVRPLKRLVRTGRVPPPPGFRGEVQPPF